MLKQAQQGLRERWAALSASTRGIIAMVVSTLAFSTMHAAIVAVARDLHPFQIAFFRNMFGLLIFIPVFWRSGAAVLHTNRLGLHMLRAVLNVLAMFAFFTALSMTPIARVTALGFTAPMFMALMSILFLGERLSLMRVAALVLGFAGALTIIRPGMVPLDAGSLLTVGSALVWAVCMVVIKQLSRTESSLTITAYMILWLSLFSFVPSLFVWQWPGLTTWIGLAFIGCAGTLAQLLLAEALKQSDATVVLPFDFLKLIWATLLGVVLFAQIPDTLTLIGAIVIFSGGFLILRSESRST